jgi:hypothetical protein
MEKRSFAPNYVAALGGNTGGLAPSVTVTASNASATPSAQLPGPASTNTMAQILVSNTTTAWAYVNFGVLGSLAAATVAASLPVPPGVQKAFSVHSEVSGASVILGAAPGTNTAVIFTRGEGLLF